MVNNADEIHVKKKVKVNDIQEVEEEEKEDESNVIMESDINKKKDANIPILYHSNSAEFRDHLTALDFDNDKKALKNILLYLKVFEYEFSDAV